MASMDDSNKFKRKWWVNPMDPEHMTELTDRDRQNGRSFNHWLLLWGVMFFGIVLVLEPHPGGMQDTPVWRLLLAFSPLVPSLFLIRAFIRLFSQMKDELIKRTYYETLAGGFLSTFFLGMCFELSAVIAGASVKAGPVMFAGLLAGYFISLVGVHRKYHV